MKHSFLSIIFIVFLSGAVFSSLYFLADILQLRVTAQAVIGEKNMLPRTLEKKRIAQLLTVKKHSESKSSRPKIVSRKEWKAKDAVGTVKEHIINRITIHHTATPQNERIPIEKKMQNLQSFSQSESRLASGKMKPVWFDVPYHYYIAVDGKIAEGRELKFVGDTNTNYDPTGHALIVLEGNFQIEQPASEQLKSLDELTAWLAARWKVPPAEIKVHNDYAATACPGENLKKLVPSLQEKIRAIKNAPGKP